MVKLNTESRLCHAQWMDASILAVTFDVVLRVIYSTLSYSMVFSMLDIDCAHSFLNETELKLDEACDVRNASQAIAFLSSF